MPSSIHVDIKDFVKLTLLYYLWAPKFYSICKGFGHGDKFCPNSMKVWRPVQPKVSAVDAQPSVDQKASDDATPEASVFSTASHVREVPDTNASQDITPMLLLIQLTVLRFHHLMLLFLKSLLAIMQNSLQMLRLLLFSILSLPLFYLNTMMNVIKKIFLLKG